MYGQGKLEDPTANHRIDMVMLAILVTVSLSSTSACSVASSGLTITLSLYSFVTSSGRIERIHLLSKLYEMF